MKDKSWDCPNGHGTLVESSQPGVMYECSKCSYQILQISWKREGENE